MRKLIPLLFALMAGAGLGLSTSRAVENGDCQIELKTCPVSTYHHVAKSDLCSDETHGKAGTCRPDWMPPDAPELVCFPSLPRGMDCEVWPQGSALVYHFVTQGSVQPSVSGTTSSPYYAFRCPGVGSSGVVQITVSAPSGTYTYASIPLACTDSGWIQ